MLSADRVPKFRSRPHTLARRLSASRSALLIAAIGIALLSLTGCGGPFVLLPGGALEGETRPAPRDWAFSDGISTIQLETRPADPYSVNIWAVGLDSALYVHAGANRASWIEHMESDPRVRVQLGDQIYSLRAARVTEASEFARFANAYEIKYGSRPRNENVAEVYVYRLAE